MKRVVKWLGIVFGALVGLLILAAIVVPLVVDVDKFRPDIEHAVNENIQGKFQLGKLSLSLWGQIRVDVDGFTLSDKTGTPVVSSKVVYFHIPFLSVLSGSPALTFKLTQPELRVVKNEKGKLNVMTLIKPSPAQDPKADKTAQPGESGTNQAALPKSLPGIVSRARLGVELAAAHLVYQDKGTSLSSEVKDLNVRIKDISLSRTMHAEVWATLDTKMAKVFEVKGPVRAEASVAPDFEGAVFKSAQVEFDANMDALTIAVPGIFEKSAKIPAHISGKLSAGTQEVAIQKWEAVFHNAVLTASGKATGLVSPDPERPANPTLALEVKSNTVDLAPWNQLSPLLKDYELAGRASFSKRVWGTLEKPEYEAKVIVDNLTAKAPMLKAKPRIDVALHVLTQQLENLKVTIVGPGTDLVLQGKVVSFTKPGAQFAVTSKGMDLDQWIEFPKPAKGSGAGAEPKKANSKIGSAQGEAADFDKMLDALRENDVAEAARATITVSIPFVKMMGIRVGDIQSRITFADLVAKLETFKFSIFDASVAMSSSVRLRPKKPTYDFSGSVLGLDFKKAVTSQLELFKNTLYGKADFKISGSGASFNPEPLVQNLVASGNFTVQNASFASMDVARMVSEGANRAIGTLGSKFPGLKGRSVKLPEDREAGYESMGASFTLKDGNFSMPDFHAKAKPGSGVDLRGATFINIKDFGLKADWEVVDTQNVTQLRNISIEEQGVKVDPLFADGTNPVVLPIRVRGKLSAPEPDYGSVPEALAKVAANNVAKAVKGKVEAEAKKRIAEELSKKAPPQLQKALEDVGKKLKLPF